MPELTIEPTAEQKKSLITFLKTPTMVLLIGGSILSFCRWNMGLIQNNAKMTSEIEFMKRYDTLITRKYEDALIQNINFMANCGAADTTHRGR